MSRPWQTYLCHPNHFKQISSSDLIVLLSAFSELQIQQHKEKVSLCLKVTRGDFLIKSTAAFFFLSVNSGIACVPDGFSQVLA